MLHTVKSPHEYHKKHKKQSASQHIQVQSNPVRKSSSISSLNSLSLSTYDDEKTPKNELEHLCNNKSHFAEFSHSASSALLAENYGTLTWAQVRKLDELLNKPMAIHGRGNYPTLTVCLKDFIRTLNKRLLNEKKIRVREIRINGGVASHILSDDENYPFSDIDIIFSCDLLSMAPYDNPSNSNSSMCLNADGSSSCTTANNKTLQQTLVRHSKTPSNGSFTDNSTFINNNTFSSCCDIIKETVLECLFDYLPKEFMMMSQRENYTINTMHLRDAYVKKMAKINEQSINHQSSSSFLANPSYASNGLSHYADIVQHALASSVESQESDCTITVPESNGANANREDETSSESSVTTSFMSASTANGSSSSSSGPSRWSLISLCNNEGRNIELKFVDRMKRQFQFSVDAFQIDLDSMLKYYDSQESQAKSNTPSLLHHGDVCQAADEQQLNTTCAMSEQLYPTVLAESMYGNFNEALYHLNSKLIATKSPEEIRGGGLLQYCNLLVRGFKPECTKMQTLEKYMCSRFFIDFNDLKEQEKKLVSYLDSHFQNEPKICVLYLNKLYEIVNASTVCLMGHERKQTLNLIDFLSNSFKEMENETSMSYESSESNEMSSHRDSIDSRESAEMEFAALSTNKSLVNGHHNQQHHNYHQNRFHKKSDYRHQQSNQQNKNYKAVQDEQANELTQGFRVIDMRTNQQVQPFLSNNTNGTMITTTGYYPYSTYLLTAVSPSPSPSTSPTPSQISVSSSSASSNMIPIHHFSQHHHHHQQHQPYHQNHTSLNTNSNEKRSNLASTNQTKLSSSVSSLSSSMASSSMLTSPAHSPSPPPVPLLLFDSSSTTSNNAVDTETGLDSKANRMGDEESNSVNSKFHDVEAEKSKCDDHSDESQRDKDAAQSSKQINSDCTKVFHCKIEPQIFFCMEIFDNLFNPPILPHFIHPQPQLQHQQQHQREVQTVFINVNGPALVQLSTLPSSCSSTSSAASLYQPMHQQYHNFQTQTQSLNNTTNLTYLPRGKVFPATINNS